ncbi:MAG: tRNA lysidine(34) synthetase TilS [Actinobacteria bacterium]|nr:tRNA lysidine(34) synthetase TilS [Actinomycetota bacterium]
MDHDVPNGSLTLNPAQRALVEDLLSRCTFPAAGTAVRCAVSGGPDSMALVALAVAAGCAVTAVHVDHGLREGSAGEAAVVRAAAQRFGAAYESTRVEVGDGPNLEARARAARHEALGPTALLGHTADDQAETVLWFLMRGTGPTGLAGIDPERRPILGLRRAETVALCAALDLDTVDDPSNEDPRFTRNRIRRELLPLMADIAQRDVVPLLANAARLQRELLDEVGPLGDHLDPTDARALAAAGRTVAIAALHRWWCETTGLAYTPDARATERMLEVARGEAPRHDVVAGWSLHRRDQRLRLEPPGRGWRRLDGRS